MKNFLTKKQVLDYINNTFLKEDVKGIAICGSTAKGKIKEFSDMDVEIFNSEKLKPYYELILVNNKLCLISIYFYKAGKETKLPNNASSLYGKYFEKIEHIGNLKYTKKERKIRNNQMLLDMLFKYIRHKDKKLLNSIEKYAMLK